MKTKKPRLVWSCKSQNKLVEIELKRKAKALLEYSIKNKIGHLSLTVIGDDYVTICAKPNSRADEYIVDAHAFMKGTDNE